jgi:hypothetical protein
MGDISLKASSHNGLGYGLVAGIQKLLLSDVCVLD